MEDPKTQKKKIRGQGPTFRGQTLSRPRTGMLEAKDQGHNFASGLKKKITAQEPHIFFVILCDVKKNVIEPKIEVQVKFSLVIFLF